MPFLLYHFKASINRCFKPQKKFYLFSLKKSSIVFKILLLRIY
ncbi:hypothetical protein CLOLEP_03697 [[Clostridium] leptum DSM 753]|uniref:Uncharacterized protein n=1 Tax=[Clostridium] leptum DSM 753 TaxID=428125 RepID=A7VYL8_9FIRM|nr:hypothetical protein CLOLEP_03697 [[Clostridium] leptum DSM 753]